MSDLGKVIASLSPEKQALLRLRLAKGGSRFNTFPLSFPQRRLWFLDRLEPGTPYYNIPSAVRLSGRLDTVALERAIGEVARRHESLRTTFSLISEEPVQVVRPTQEVRLDRVDLSHLEPARREAEAFQVARSEASRPFDLSRGPLIRCTLVTLDAQEHMLVCVMHHIISDGWSQGVFIREVATLYQAFQAGKRSPLPDLSLQYADFAAWQNAWMKGEVMERQLAYWRERLADMPPTLDLPTDFPRPAVFSSRGAAVSRTMPQPLLDRMHELAHEEGATLFMVLLAAIQALLSRYTAQDDIAVGTPVANRTQPATETLIGFFVNTLVLRTDFSGDPTFREILRRVRETAVGAFSHQDLPFEKLVEELNPHRDMSRTPIFQVMFVLQNIGRNAVLEIPGLKLKQVHTHSGTSTFDLTLLAGETHPGLEVLAEYNTDLFLEGTVVRMLAHLQVLLELAVRSPDVPLSRCSLLEPAERERVVVAWNQTDRAFDDGLCVHALFEAHVPLHREQTAVVQGEHELTYGELNARANRLAHFLMKRGVAPEAIVGVSVERSLDMIVALLGVLKAGGAFLPLDPRYPRERLAAMLEDSGAAVVLARRENADAFRGQAWSVISVDEDRSLIEAEPDGNPVTSVGPENRMYVIYTSGSTGKPKGVDVIHRSVVNHNQAVIGEYGLTPRDRVLQFASLNFDASIEEIFPSLLSGAAVILRDDEMLLSGAELLRFVAHHRITVLNFPTAFWHEWVYDLERMQANLPPDVRLVVLGGEKASGEKAAAWYRTVGGKSVLLNTYGPTETTIISTLYRCTPPVSALDGMPTGIPIGRPIANTCVYLLDRSLQPVPIGTPGELFVGGVGVARGYLGRPGLTAERFIPDPFSSQAGGRMYRTGDVARYRADGMLEFVGRTDEQVKIRGFRVEPGEVESILGGHPSVREVAVVVRPGASPAADHKLVAYYALGGDQKVTAADMRSLLRNQLPEYMIPQAFVLLDRLPRTPSGKIDRRGLPEPSSGQADAEANATPLRTVTEEMLADVWKELLGLPAVGADDNFFDRGGHSLLATKLVARIQSLFDVELPLRSVFEEPTLAGLALRVDRSMKAKENPEHPPLERIPRDGVLPLSYAQQRLWFLDQLEPDSVLYNVPDAIRLKGRLHAEALEESLNTVVRRHEVLRSRYRTVEGKPAVVIDADLRVPLRLHDLRAVPEGERERRGHELVREEASRPFDLAEGPLLRAGLVRMHDDDHLLYLVLHHIVCDGWSTEVVVREMVALYAALDSGEKASLPELPVQYADYASWQRRWLQGDVLERQLSYWKKQLDGIPSRLAFPTDRPRPAVQTSRGASFSFSIDSRLAASLRAMSRNEGVTLFMLTLAAFQVLLHRWSRQTDITVGTPIANRPRPELEGMIGFFVNTLVMRASFAGDPPFRELLRRTRDAAIEAYAHQDVPFEKIVDAVQPERDMSHTPLFQVMFLLQNAQRQSQQLPGLSAEAIRLETGVSPFDLTLVVSETSEGFLGGIEFNADLFDTDSIARLARQYVTLLEGIVADPGRLVSQLPLASERELQQVLDEWNRTDSEIPPDFCVHHLLERQSARTPDAIAVRSPAGNRTYRDLNEQADRIATVLRRMGVGPEVVVGLLTDRSAEMLVGLFGILKAGGAYLPLDRRSPGDRLASMCREAGVTIVLTVGRVGIPMPADIRVLLLDDQEGASAATGDETPIVPVTQENLAYVIFTSGSTGTPKGVGVCHRSVVNHAVAMTKEFALTSADRVLQFASISFDAAAEEIFPTLGSGGTLVLPEDEALSAGTEFLEFIAREHLTVLDLPTAFWNEWVYDISTTRAPLPASLRLVIVGGDKAPVERAALWNRVGTGDIRWLNTYGPTEGTIVATLFDPLGPPATDREIPIGRPIANARTFILDGQLKPVPVGVPGELFIGGAGVARGYIGRPDLTAERFFPDPYSGQPGARMYSTGDLARYREDGQIEFLGRVDHQVKIRGFRVELGEVEATLLKMPAVREAVVVAREIVPGDKRLVAYCVLQQKEEGNTRDLRESLRGMLPDYMVPSVVVTLDQLPRTTTGKIDRRALPAPEADRRDASASFEAPRSDTEALLVEVWQHVLGVRQIGIRDNFFELGGDSILTIQVVARARQAGLSLTPKDMFQNPTVESLARVARAASVSRAEQGPVVGDVPLSPVQRWFFEQEIATPHHWNQSLLFRVAEQVDPGVVREVVQDLQRHHDALRLRFSPGPEGWVQTIVPPDDTIPFEHIDLSGIPPAGRSEAIESAAERYQRGLDLVQGPVWRVVLFNVAADGSPRLLIIIHHLAVDGVSWRILLEDLRESYGARRMGHPPNLPPKTTSVREWGERLRAAADTEVFDEDRRYWLSRSHDPVVQIAVDFDRGEPTEASSESVAMSLSEEQTRRLLQDVPAAYGTEITEVLLAALVEAVSQWTGARVVDVELEGHGREQLFNELELSRTVGWFTLIYPVRLDLRAVSGPGGTLKSVKEQVRAIPRRGMGFGILRYLSTQADVRASLQALPRPQISFNYLGQFGGGQSGGSVLEGARERKGAERDPRSARTHLLDINGGIHGGSLRMEITYSVSQLARPRVELFGQRFGAALEAIIAHCQTPDAVGYTPSDFGLAGLDQRKLERVLDRIQRPKNRVAQ